MGQGIKLMLFAFAAGSVLLLQAADCMSLDQETMPCCATMPCAPAMKNHKCCKALVPGQTAGLLPAGRQSLQPPVLAVVEYAPVVALSSAARDLRIHIEAQQHSPPDLYTRHHSFLI